MAVIWRCDRCGFEAKDDQIVGHEFKYADHGFGSLAVKVGAVRDLCGPCMKKAHDAEREYRTDNNRGLWAFIKERLAV